MVMTRPQSEVRPEEGKMAFHAVDVRDQMIRRLDAGSARQAWAKAGAGSEPLGSAVCNSCRHRHCAVCEECSVAQQYSDYWICHCCGALTQRGSSLYLREVSNGLGEN
jgi:hypothetical protein